MVVYILFSKKGNIFYTGYTSVEITRRIQMHNEGFYKNSYTSRYSDWVLYFHVKCDSRVQAVGIERHIKTMKSKKYIMNLREFPELVAQLKLRYLKVGE